MKNVGDQSSNFNNPINLKNKSFYRYFPVGMLNTHYARAAGLEKAYELGKEPLHGLSQHANSILEIGAGEGRIIEGLLDRNYKGMIYGVERCPAFINQLNQSFEAFDNVKILDKDILLEDAPKVDLGLFLFSGFLEFSKKEQEYLVKKLSGFCKTLIIDTPLLYLKTDTTYRQNLVLKTSFGTVYGRIPLESEIKKWTYTIDKSVHTIRYTTNTGKKRQFFVIQ